MKMKILVCISLIGLFFISCKSDKNKEKYELLCSNKFLNYPIDDNTKSPQRSIYTFTDNEQTYLSFQDERLETNAILIYDIHSGSFVKKVTLPSEGDKSVGRFGGYYIEDFEHIYISNLYIQEIAVVDTALNIKQKIKFPQTTDSKEMLIPFLLSSNKQITFADGKLYVPQTVNPMLKEDMMEKSRVCLCIDTVAHTIEMLPMKFPPLITYKDVGTSASSGDDYSRCFNGKDFIYSFDSSDVLYRVPLSHKEVKEVIAKSRYIDKVEVLRIKSTDMKEVAKAMCEHPSYGGIIYDKYRKVYYRIVYPECEIEADADPISLNRSGRRVFSIMILDEELNIVGETLFPEYTYNPHLWFILEDGLYLSTSHVKNPQYSDDMLTFQRIDLKNN